MSSTPDYRQDLVAFARDFLGAEPMPWQIELLQRVERGERLVVMGGRPARRRTLAMFEAWMMSTTLPTLCVVISHGSDRITL